MIISVSADSDNVVLEDNVSGVVLQGTTSVFYRQVVILVRWKVICVVGQSKKTIGYDVISERGEKRTVTIQQLVNAINAGVASLPLFLQVNLSSFSLNQQI